MDDLQCLKTRRFAAKSSMTKLLSKVDGVLSAELESVNSQSVKEERKLMAESTLRDNETALEEEIATADAYQFELDDRIAFLTEFLRRANQAPPVSTIAHVIPPTSPPPTGIQL